MFSGVGKVSVVMFSSYRGELKRGHAFKGWNLALMKNVSEFAED